MQDIWKKTSVFIWLMVFGFVFFLPGAFAQEPAENAEERAAEVAATEIRPQPRHLVVTYFHTTFRCPTCHKIETYSNDAVHFNFEDELKSGKLVWRVINVEEPEHKHFVKDYQLYSKHLIVSEMKDGKEVRWKDLTKVWTCVRDEAVFNDYVKTEISDWLKE
jgi:hypothetical protein